VAQADFEFWIDEAKLGNELLKAFIAGAHKQLLPNRDRMLFVKDGQEILPGVQAMSAPGRTVGHMPRVDHAQDMIQDIVQDIIEIQVIIEAGASRTRSVP
jgi:hypothetical protein